MSTATDSSSLDSSSTDSTPSTSAFFTTGFPSTTTASGDSSNGSNNNNGGITASSSLYLFTFLATLLLLLAVSCAIVIRSLVLRRRFRRRVQEALANGVVLPPQPGGFTGAMMFGGGRLQRDFGEKPTMWDRWLAPPLELELTGSAGRHDEKENYGYGYEYEYEQEEDEGDGGPKRWSDIMPVSSKVLSDRVFGNGVPRPDPSSTSRPSVIRSLSGAGTDLRSGSEHLVRRVRRWPFFHRNRPSSPNSNNPSSPQPGVDPSSLPHDSPSTPNDHPTSVPPDEPSFEDASMQLTVLIAMPSRFRPRAWDPQRYSHLKAGSTADSASHDEEDEDLPEVSFGVTEVPWKVRVPKPNADVRQQS